MGRGFGPMTSMWTRISVSSGWLALLFLALLSVGTVLAVAIKGSGWGGWPVGSFAAIQFTLLQAGLSAFASTALAIPLARALTRQRFYGRNVLISLLGAPFLLPVLVAVLGILGIFGRSGLVSAALHFFNLPPLNIYGLPGVLLVHVYFNLPLAIRMVLQGWSDIPGEQFRLASQLNLSKWSVFRLLEWPILRRVLPNVFLLVFLLCSTSFAVVLAIGGGPGATTVELAIYHALRFDFDLAGASQLALLQIVICGSAAFLISRFRPEAIFGTTRMVFNQRWDAHSALVRWADLSCISLALLFLASPIIVVAGRGIPAILAGLPASVWPAAARSLFVALVSSMLTLLLGLALAGLIASNRKFGSKMAEIIAPMLLAVSPFVIGTGLFIMINPVADPFALALPVTAIVNSALCIPLALRLLVPAMAKASRRYARLADSLDLQGWARFWIVFWPELRQPAFFSAALTAALSIGDLGVIALFAPPDGGTLPLVMQRLMATYQMDSAAGVAVVLVTLALTLFWIIDRGGRLGD